MVMHKTDTFQRLLVDEMQNLYGVERQKTRILRKMMRTATSNGFKDLLRKDIDEASQQLGRLNDAFKSLGIRARAAKSPAIRGLVEEGEEFIGSSAKSEVQDAGLIGIAQKLEHYEIAGYGTAVAHANQIGNSEVIRLLQENLRGEKEADMEFTQLAEKKINIEAERKTD